jgi:hypothetical protein
MADLESGLSDVIDAQEPIARFVFSHRNYDQFGAKPVAFLPNTDDRETSVSRHDKTPEDSLWEIGNNIVTPPRTLHGAAIFKAKVVSEDAKLKIDPAEPPPRHAVITGWSWPNNDPKLYKAAQLNQAMLLAQNSKFIKYNADAVVPPSPSPAGI